MQINVAETRIFINNNHRMQTPGFQIPKWIFTVAMIIAVPWILWRQWQLLSLGVQYDEAYTALNYAWSGVGTALTTYDLPNNHVWNSVLLALLFKIFSPTIFNLHLISFGAFVLSLFTGFKILRNNPVAQWIWFLFFSTQGLFIHYGVEARGYGLNVLYVLLSLLALQKYRTSQNGKFYGRALRAAAFGLWAVPTYLYSGMIPFLVYGDWWKFSKKIFRTILMVALMWLPIFIYVKSFGVKLGGEHYDWTTFFKEWPGYLKHQAELLLAPSFWLIPVGLLALFIYGERLSKRKVGFLFLLPLLLMLLTKTLPPFERLWLPWLALASLWSALGASKIRNGFLQAGLVIITSVLSLSWYAPAYERVQMQFKSEGELKKIERYLSEHVRPGDFVAMPVAYKDQLRYLGLAEDNSMFRWKLFPIEEKWRLGIYLVYDSNTMLSKPGPQSVIWRLSDGEAPPELESVKFKAAAVNSTSTPVSGASVEDSSASTAKFRAGRFEVY